MIFLFDEKTDRRSDYGWFDSRIEECNDVLKSFSTYEFIDNCDISSFGDDCDVVFIHESFFSGVGYDKKGKAEEIKRKLDNKNKSGKAELVVYAGSKASRKSDGSKAFMPVSVFYQNLSFFVDKYREGNKSLDNIVYGKNANLEKVILKRIEDANNQMAKEDDSFQWDYEAQSSMLLIKMGYENYLQSEAFQNSDCVILDYEIDKDEPISDEFLNDFILKELNTKEYEKLFVPLCFGPTLSDFNGLRLALHIRCTQCKNQFSSIFIYSPIGFSAIINNEYFDILKTSNVFIIDYSCKAIYKALLRHNTDSDESIRRSLLLINLKPPKNYIDSHSIANEWAIYRWSQTIKMSETDEEINKIIEKIDYNIYFKYLKTIYPPQEATQLDDSDLMIEGIKEEMTFNNPGDPRILLVDDEAERGWYELFDAIIQKNNPHLYVDYLGKDHFVGKDQNGIIDIIGNKVKNENFNIVILDFRLHSDDFKAEKVEEITGYKVLCKIKEINSGIQVIILSATNKVWNLQKLQKQDANGFIIKESPYNSKDSEFTAKTIKSFVDTMGNAVNNRFKKTLFEKCKKIINNLRQYDLSTDAFEIAIKAYQKQIEIVLKSIPQINQMDKNSIDITFISCFNVFEILKNKFLNENKFYKYTLGNEEGDVYKIEESNKRNNVHRMQNPVLINSLFKQNHDIIRPSLYDFIGSFLIYIGVSKPHIKDGLLVSLWNIVDWRNDFIHGTKPHFSKDELMTIVDMLELISKHLKP